MPQATVCAGSSARGSWLAGWVSTCSRRSRSRPLRSGQGEGGGLRRSGPLVGQLDGVAGLARQRRDHDLLAAGRRLTVDLGDDVAGLQPGLRARAGRLEDEEPGRCARCLGDRGRYLLNLETGGRVTGLAGLDQLVGDRGGEVDRDGEAQAYTSAAADTR